MRQTRIRAKTGFTLIEMLIAVIIVGILGAMLLLSVVPSKKRAEETTCLANITELNRIYQISQMTDKYSSNDVKALLTSLDNEYFSNAPKCPTTGEYKLNDENKFYCNEHSDEANLTAEQKIGNSIYETTSGFFAKIAELVKSGKTIKEALAQLGVADAATYLRNEDIRTALWAANGNKWQQVTIDGKTLYAQVMANYGAAAGEGIADRGDASIIVFANTNSSNTGNWHADYVYDHNTQTWYTWNSTLAGKTWADVQTAINNGTITAVK